MTTFIQLHLLTAYPPANLNRDDTGKPKTAMFGNVDRLRISSQSLKRAWRTSDVFETALNGHLAKRTQRLGDEVNKHLLSKGVDEKKALEIACGIAGHFGKVKSSNDKNPAFIEQLVFVSAEERESAFALAERAVGEDIDLKNAALLRKTDAAVDIAMFGRMLADDPAYNREAAVQVAHAITTHRALVEDDYYTAVDDLKTPDEDAGAGFVGEAGFGSGVFYLYLCINRDLLIANLGGDENLAKIGIAALVEAAAKVAPKGKQASFASRAYAGHGLVERGNEGPRTLAASFLKPVGGDVAGGDDVAQRSFKALELMHANFARAYGDTNESAVMDVPGGRGSLADLIALASR